MNKTASIYLDLVRFLSAVLVLVFHAKYTRFDGGWLTEIGAYGHDAVMVFFVLSGFVIAYITQTRESTLSEYSKSRLARLYSVMVPALILTLVLDYFGKGLNPAMYIGGHYQATEPVYRFFANLLFANELWFSSWRAFSNGPFWSLPFEFWYYVIFATWFFFEGYKRWLLTAIAMLIAGPKIVILLPVWVMGAITFHLSSRITISKLLALILALAPIAAYVYIRETEMQKTLLAYTVEVLGHDFVYYDLKWSRRFISDFIVGGLVSMHLFGMITLSKSFSFPSLFEKTIRYFAGMTFAVYLLHYPLLQFFGSVTHNGPIIVALTFVTIMFIAPVTEGQKRRWYTWIDKLFGLFARLSKTAIKLVRT